MSVLPESVEAECVCGTQGDQKRASGPALQMAGRCGCCTPNPGPLREQETAEPPWPPPGRFLFSLGGRS